MEQAEDFSARAAEFRSIVEDPTRLRSWVADSLPVVHAFVLARCGDETIAEDITQETMVAVVRQRADFDGRAEPTTWVCGIARHKIADHYRAKYREERRRLRLVQRAPEPQPLADTGETRQAVMEALRQVPEAQRVVLAFHYLDELSVKEIAERIGRSESAVESLLARGRTAFRKAWDDTEGGSP